MKPVPVQALIFDLDGTLIDSCADIAASLNYVLGRLNLPVKSPKEVQSFVGDGVKILFSRATGNADPALIDQAVALFRPHYLEHCVDQTVLYPGVRDVLERYRAKKCAVVSNKPLEMVDKTLEHFGVRHFFESVMGADSTPNRKPHPEPVQKTLERLKVKPDAAIMVGDGTADMEAGAGAGVKTCAVTYGYRSRAELQKTKPDFFIESILELKNLIQ